MPLGEVDEDRSRPLPAAFGRARRTEARWTLTPSEARSGGPARYVDVAETGGRIGFITPLTNNFCDGCNRIRVTADRPALRLPRRLGAGRSARGAALRRSRHADRRSARPRDADQARAAPFQDRARRRVRPSRATCRLPAADPVAVKIVFLGKLADLAGAPEKRRRRHRSTGPGCSKRSTARSARAVAGEKVQGRAQGRGAGGQDRARRRGRRRDRAAAAGERGLRWRRTSACSSEPFNPGAVRRPVHQRPSGAGRGLHLRRRSARR